ncbi:hypothetical protein VULLAG_LOCUS14204 [Vulpes lagopus]
MKDRERQSQEKQAPCKEPYMGLDPWTLGSRPEPKADVQPLGHPRFPGQAISDAYTGLGIVCVPISRVQRLCNTHIVSTNQNKSCWRLASLLALFLSYRSLCLG